MKVTLWTSCVIAILLSLSFCFIAYAEYRNETKVKSNSFTIEQQAAEEAEIDWVDSLYIQWCEYPFAE